METSNLNYICILCQANLCVHNDSQVVSNDEYKSVEHRVVIKSAQEPRVSIALFFNPAEHGRSDFFGPLPELVTEEKPARYRSLSWQQMLNNRIALGHAKPSALDQFRVTLN
jgi:hypothetical protein